MTAAAVARRIHDDAAFLKAVSRLTSRYAALHRLEKRLSASEARKALVKFQKLGREMTDWLSAGLHPDETPTRDAARKLNAALMETGQRSFAVLQRLQADLTTLCIASNRATEMLQGDYRRSNARRDLASQLWTMLPAHGIAVKMHESSDAVRLLIAVARESGDRHLTAGAARKLLEEAQPTRSK